MTVLLALALIPGLLTPTQAGLLRVEAGALQADGEHFLVRDPGLRAVAPGSDGSHARVTFTYRGPTQRTAALASGELRRQIGLKLRAQDTCNVIYVMWHIEPKPDVQVQVKSNPGKATHRECGDHGYRTLKANTHGTPVIRVGESHALDATLQGRSVTVRADDVVVWQGELPEDPAFDGPAGIRTDNAEFSASLWTVPK